MPMPVLIRYKCDTKCLTKQDACSAVDTQLTSTRKVMTWAAFDSKWSFKKIAGCRGFATRSLVRGFRGLGIEGERKRRAIRRRTTNAVERAPRWLWPKRGTMESWLLGTRLGHFTEGVLFRKTRNTQREGNQWGCVQIGIIGVLFYGQYCFVRDTLRTPPQVLTGSQTSLWASTVCSVMLQVPASLLTFNCQLSSTRC